MTEFPNDADGDALRDLARRADLSKQMTIDFTVVVPDEQSGRAFEATVRERGYSPKLDFDAESGIWTCYCTKKMLVTYDEVIACQAELNKIGADIGAECDGWGTFGE